MEKDQWKFDEEHQCWAMEDVLYTAKATVPDYQKLSIFVPAPYMKEGGVIDPEGSRNGYTAESAPIVLNNRSAGYSQMQNMRLDDKRCRGTEYLRRGFVYVTCGNRGNGSVDQNGNSEGKIPANLVDLKMVVRFLRHYAAEIPGDTEKIISVGTSAGGAMSALLGVTGNSKNYDRYLEEAGAYMEERDDVFASQCYCPITDLDHADAAYEWMFGADKENEESHAGKHSVMTPFQEALSKKLSESYIRYFNGLGLKDPDTGAPLALNADGRSGSAYDYLMNLLSASATRHLAKFGEGVDSCSWLTRKGEEAVISDLDSYILNHRRRMKPCTSFDTLPCASRENQVYGSKDIHAVHFSADVAEAIDALKDEFPEECAQYASYAQAKEDDVIREQRLLNNPMQYIGTGEQADQARYYRIRVGSVDADTSFAISMALALKLANAGKQVDYALVWDQPHCDADYPGEFCDWIESIC